MLLRVIFSLLALGVLTAFAPRAIPKPARGVPDVDQITVANFQGTWRVTGMVRYNSDGTAAPHKWQVSHVRVKDDWWTFMHNETASNGYRITIDNAKRPAALDFTPDAVGRGKGGGSTGKGIIRRKGDVVEIVYLFGGPPRPESFERPPAGYYLLTLQRQR